MCWRLDALVFLAKCWVNSAFSFLYHLWCSYFPHWWIQTENWLLPQSVSPVYAFLMLCSTASKWETPASKQLSFCYVIIFPVCYELSNWRIHFNYSRSTAHNRPCVRFFFFKHTIKEVLMGTRNSCNHSFIKTLTFNDYYFV